LENYKNSIIEKLMKNPGISFQNLKNYFSYQPEFEFLNILNFLILDGVIYFKNFSFKKISIFDDYIENYDDSLAEFDLFQNSDHSLKHFFLISKNLLN
jgi:coproporphyrinogen III oxidase-like Fe-S oxidoreductase